MINRFLRSAARGVSSKLVTAIAAGLACSTASATWSILIVDTRTGEIAVGSATCVPGINLRANTPVLILGRGAVTAQSAVDISGGNRARVFAGFAKGLTLDEIFADLAANDTGHGNRQYGFVDTTGDALTYSGVNNAAWAGGVTGRIEAGAPGPADDIVYAVQGNILTGAPVVDMAVQAILDTPGDLAEKMMAGMEAAYAFGGDGRCSCFPGKPTACGAPPVDGFIKTADVGYMLVGRLGDREQSGSFDVLDAGVSSILVDDFDQDGRSDLVSFPNFSGGVVFRRNITPGDGPAIFDATDIATGFGRPAFAGSGDIDGDGDADVVFIAGSIHVALNNGDGTFASPVASQAFGGPRDAVLGEFDASSPGLELATIAGDAIDTYAIDAAGGATRIANQPNAASNAADGIAAIPGGVLLHSGAENRFISFSANGDGTFSAGGSINASLSGDRFETGDLNGDGDFDVVYQAGSSSISVLRSDGQGGYDTITGITVADPSPRVVRDFSVVDTDGDGDDDVAILARFGRFAIASDDGGAGIQVSSTRRVLEGTALGVGDVTSDGLPDFVTADGLILGAYENQGGNIPADDPGFAGGDYFLELNVAGGPAFGYDDPVPQLRDEFDAWRATKVGVVDGSVSSLTVPWPMQRFTHGRLAETTDEPFEIHPFDYSGTRVLGLSTENFSIETPSGRPAAFAPVAFVDAEFGPSRLSVQTIGVYGEQQLWVRVTEGGNTAVIQPIPTVRVARTQADLDANGRCDLADIELFVNAFQAGDELANLDFDDDGPDLQDVDIFVQEFIAGAP